MRLLAVSILALAVNATAAGKSDPCAVSISAICVQDEQGWKVDVYLRNDTNKRIKACYRVGSYDLGNDQEVITRPVQIMARVKTGHVFDPCEPVRLKPDQVYRMYYLNRLHDPEGASDRVRFNVEVSSLRDRSRPLCQVQSEFISLQDDHHGDE